MKKIFAFLTVIMLAIGLYAQSPESMSYQAVVRNSSGAVLPNQVVAFRFSILNGGSIEYSEIQNVTTNNLGLVSLSIGQGSAQVGDFYLLDWKNNQYMLQVELDVNGGSAFVNMSTTQFLSVPYALHAKTAEFVDDADADPTNEIELPATAVSGQVLTYDGSAWVAQNSGSGSDNWGSQVAQTNSTLSGNGTSVSPLGLAAQGANSGQVLKWNGSAWAPASDDNTMYNGGTGISVVGTTITNTAPDQTVSLVGGGGTTVFGIYPNFTIFSADSVDDDDADPANELQDISLAGSNLSISSGSTINLSSIDTDDQTLSISGNTLSISDGNSVTLTDNVNDADSDPTNEIELPATAVSGQVLTYDGSAWVAQNSGSGSDNWGSQVAQTNSTLSGNGTSVSPLGLAAQGANSGDVLKWNGSAWAPSSDDNTTYSAGTGISISGSNIINTLPDQTVTIVGSGSTSVTGTYPNFTVSSTDNVDDADNDPTNEIELPATANSGEVLTWNGSDWVAQSVAAASGWALTGNTALVDTVNFIGTTDSVAVNFRVNDKSSGRIGMSADGSVFLGYKAGSSDDMTYNRNTFIGFQSGSKTYDGSANTAVGFSSLANNDGGDGNTAVGEMTLSRNDYGMYNSAFGLQALNSNTDGGWNVAIGSNAMNSSTHGEKNISIGTLSMYFNTTGNRNSVIGTEALYSNTSGNENTALGYQTLYTNNTGTNNIAVGDSALYSNVSGSYNTAIGEGALNSNVAGSNGTAFGCYAMGNTNNSSTAFENTNVAIGFHALFGSSTVANNTGINNVAVGYAAMVNNSTGNNNTAQGYISLYSNTTGVNNAAYGSYSLSENTKGNDNVAIGIGALYNNVSGSKSIAIGSYAMYHVNNSTTAFDNTNIAIGYMSLYGSTTPQNNTGNSNIAIGHYALSANTSGYSNTAIGELSLTINTSGYQNTAIGVGSLNRNKSGYRNAAFGHQVLAFVDSGYHNTGAGFQALYYNTTGYGNTALGYQAGSNNTTGNKNTMIGNEAYIGDSSATNSTVIGNGAWVSGSNTVAIGNSDVTSIGGYAAWTNISDARFKKDIKQDVPGLDFIMKLEPVTYKLDKSAIAEFHNIPDSARNFESEAASESIIHTGFLAQDVEKAAQNIGFEFSGVDTPKNENDHYGLRYSMFVVPLVQATQEQQVVIEQQQEIIEDLLIRIESLEKKVNASDKQ